MKTLKKAALIAAFASIVLLAGCVTLPEFEVFEGPMQNGVRQPLRVQVIVPASETDIIIVRWGDGAESTWGGVVYMKRANVQHGYNTEGIYTIAVSRNGESLGARRVMVEEMP